MYGRMVPLGSLLPSILAAGSTTTKRRSAFFPPLPLLRFSGEIVALGEVEGRRLKLEVRTANVARALHGPAPRLTPATA